KNIRSGPPYTTFDFSREIDEHSEERIQIDRGNARKFREQLRRIEAGEDGVFLPHGVLERRVPRATFNLLTDEDRDVVKVTVRLFAIDSPRNTEENRELIEGAIEQAWNDRALLVEGGDTFKVEFDVQWVVRAEDAHRKVSIAPERVHDPERPGELKNFRDRVTDERATIDEGAAAAAHEFGHILGLHDQYTIRRVPAGGKEGAVRFVDPKKEVEAGRELPGIMYDGSLRPIESEFGTVRRAFALDRAVDPSSVMVMILPPKPAGGARTVVVSE